MRPVGRYLEIKKVDGQDSIVCTKCGHVLSPANGNFKGGAVKREVPLRNAAAHFPASEETRFVLREFYCPGCATMLEVDQVQPGEPDLWDIQLE